MFVERQSGSEKINII